MYCLVRVAVNVCRFSLGVWSGMYCLLRLAVNVCRFSFVVVPNAFIIHQPHAPSLDIARYRASATYRECLKVFKSDFQRYLSRKYGIRALKYLSPDT